MTVAVSTIRGRVCVLVNVAVSVSVGDVWVLVTVVRSVVSGRVETSIVEPSLLIDGWTVMWVVP